MNTSQKRAIETHRRRLGERGLARYEVRGLAGDKELVRALARRLAADDAAAARLRGEIERGVQAEPPSGRDIWQALRSSPFVGLDFEVEREFSAGRDISL
jgi:hypothetical protein